MRLLPARTIKFGKERKMDRRTIYNQVWCEPGDIFWSKVRLPMYNAIKKTITMTVQNQVYNQVSNLVYVQVRDQVNSQVIDQVRDQVKEELK